MAITCQHDACMRACVHSGANPTLTSNLPAVHPVIKKLLSHPTHPCTHTILMSLLPVCRSFTRLRPARPMMACCMHLMRTCLVPACRHIHAPRAIPQVVGGRRVQGAKICEPLCACTCACGPVVRTRSCPCACAIQARMASWYVMVPCNFRRLCARFIWPPHQPPLPTPHACCGTHSPCMLCSMAEARPAHLAGCCAATRCRGRLISRTAPPPARRIAGRQRQGRSCTHV